MSRNLPPDLLSRTKQILLPLVASEDERDELLIDAFYLSDSRLYYEIDRNGAAGAFASKLVKKLLDYGCLTDGKHSLVCLLSAARESCGADKHKEIDELVRMLNDLGQQPLPTAMRPQVVIPIPGNVITVDTPRDERRPTIFISYSRADTDFANRLIADLAANGHACWIDTTSVKGGDEWVQTIADGIINSYALVVVITSNALNSKWVQREILWAQRRKKLIIPWILEDVMHEKGFLPMADCQGVTLYDRDYEAALETLLRSLPTPVATEIKTEEAAPNRAAETVRISKPPGLQRKLELAYLDRLRLEDLLNTDKYTPMSGVSQQKLPRAEMSTVFELLSMNKDRTVRREPKHFDDAVKEIRCIRRVVLLGEPGGGKTTTIWKLAADLVVDALRDRMAPIPLLVRLGRWTDLDRPLRTFIGSQLGDLGVHLDNLLNQKRAALLLDGLNELPAGQRDIKYKQVQKFIEEHRDLLAVVSCRELDYTIDLGFDLINIRPLDPMQIRDFAGRYLGAEQGEALFWKLAGGDAVRATCEVWRQAGASFEMFWSAQDIPRENPDVYSRTSPDQDRVWHEKVRGKHSIMELASNPYMLLMLTSVYAEEGELPENRGELFRLFVKTLLERERVAEIEEAPLTDGLAKVAYVMQMRRSTNEETRVSDAVTVLPREEVNDILGERRLYLAGSSSILSVGEQVRFTHQLLQEYFSARYMDLEIRAGRLKASDIWPFHQWWGRTNWEEATVLLAGLYSDDCTPVVEWVAHANPEAAARCVIQSGAALAGATRERLRSGWIPRLTDLGHEPKPEARAAVGRALGLTGWDNRKGVGVVNDQNGVALPDIDWVEIPAGEFAYGDNSEFAAPRNLTLPTFHISRYGVTYAQFQTFLDDPEGYANPRWFDGLSAEEADRRMEEQYFKFANHPRETVNWYQAMAFCRWFSWRLGGSYDLKKISEWPVRPATEFEWEKAARGTDGRIYPYKGDFDATKCNTSETGLRQTTAVGIFPNGASPYGVMDMSGNVWEWCLSNYDKPALEARKENLRSRESRVLRGGSWDDDRGDARAVFRGYGRPSSRLNLVGFRVVCSGLRPPSL